MRTIPLTLVATIIAEGLQVGSGASQLCYRPRGGTFQKSGVLHYGGGSDDHKGTQQN